jgi:hypothetical protein
MAPEQFVLTIILFAVGVPVVLGIGSDMFKRWLKLKEKEIDSRTAALDATVAAQSAQIERLEQRVRVLERIATDKGTALAAEIESLPPLPARDTAPMRHEI